MNYAIILSGGVGSRMKSNIPKQYIERNGVPIIIDTLFAFEKCENIDKIIVVAADAWKDKISEWCAENSFIKVCSITTGGDSRQESILNGLKVCMTMSYSEKDKVIIHDAVRPFVTFDTINACLEAIEHYDGAMPVLEVKDTIYQSDDGKVVTALLNRDTLFAGQSPEAFLLHKYYEINKDLSKEELGEIRGTSQIAFQHGFSIKMINGDENNFKLTTPADLERYYKIKGE